MQLQLQHQAQDWVKGRLPSPQQRKPERLVLSDIRQSGPGGMETRVQRHQETTGHR